MVDEQNAVARGNSKHRQKTDSCAQRDHTITDVGGKDTAGECGGQRKVN